MDQAPATTMMGSLIICPPFRTRPHNPSHHIDTKSFFTINFSAVIVVLLLFLL